MFFSTRLPTKVSVCLFSTVFPRTWHIKYFVHWLDEWADIATGVTATWSSQAKKVLGGIPKQRIPKFQFSNSMLWFTQMLWGKREFSLPSSGSFWLVEWPNQHGTDWQEKMKFNSVLMGATYTRVRGSVCRRDSEINGKLHVYLTFWAGDEERPLASEGIAGRAHVQLSVVCPAI